MNNLMIIKTALNEFVLSDVVYNEDKTGYLFMNPITIEMGDSTLAATEFLPGSDANAFPVPFSYIITMAKPNDLHSKFYGSCLYKQSVERFLLNTPFSGHPSGLDEFINAHMSLVKQEIFQTYGMLGADYSTDTIPKVIH